MAFLFLIVCGVIAIIVVKVCYFLYKVAFDVCLLLYLNSISCACRGERLESLVECESN